MKVSQYLSQSKKLIRAKSELARREGELDVMKGINDFEIKHENMRARRGKRRIERAEQNQKKAADKVQKYELELGLDNAEDFYSYHKPLLTQTIDSFSAKNPTTFSYIQPRGSQGLTNTQLMKQASMSLYYLHEEPLRPISLRVGRSKSFRVAREQDIILTRNPIISSDNVKRNPPTKRKKNKTRNTNEKSVVNNYLSVMKQKKQKKYDSESGYGTFSKMEPHLFPRVAIEVEEIPHKWKRTEFTTMTVGGELFDDKRNRFREDDVELVKPRWASAPNIREIFKDVHEKTDDKDYDCSRDRDSHSSVMREIRNFEEKQRILGEG